MYIGTQPLRFLLALFSLDSVLACHFKLVKYLGSFSLSLFFFLSLLSSGSFLKNFSDRWNWRNCSNLQDWGVGQQFKSNLETTVFKHAAAWQQGKFVCVILYFLFFLNDIYTPTHIYWWVPIHDLTVPTRSIPLYYKSIGLCNSVIDIKLELVEYLVIFKMIVELFLIYAISKYFRITHWSLSVLILIAMDNTHLLGKYLIFYS